MSEAVSRFDPPVTLEDFLLCPGDGTDTRYQLIDGVVVAMAPASVIHGAIQSNIIGLLRDHLKARNSPCRVITTPGVAPPDLVPRSRRGANFRIPDVGVTCDPITADRIILTDPVLLVEILSPSNPAPTWLNVWAYTTIPSLREILVLHSTKAQAYLLRRQADGTWPDTPMAIAEPESLRLDSVDLAFALIDAYEGTDLR